ncbi:MAG: MBL fold metallo-hydrolase [Acidobacteria bacterium]|nr:MBL fold metallo-hydrolase [Acidobacteriota bacterium]MCL5288700.1 MBL fold metallo-hydrolase [Acidobacteriota bacterium]
MRHPVGWSRRDFLTSASCLGAAMACSRLLPAAWAADSIAQDPRVAATPLLDKGFASSRKIGDGVYATIADTTKGYDALCNGGFIVGRDAALLIEGHHLPTAAAFELEALRMVSQAPVRAALNTHYHFDHSFGNAFYGAQRFPIMAHAKSAGMIVERYASLQSGGAPALLSGFEKAAQEARDEIRKQRAAGDLQAANLLVNSSLHTALTLPSEPLDPAKLPVTIELGGLSAVIEAHHGHTPTDITIRVPSQNIVFTGDLLFNGSYPVAFDANMAGWMKALDTFAKWGKDTLFVPGHGAVCGQEAVAQERGALEDLGNHAQKMFKAGVSWQEAAQRYEIPEKFKKLGYFSWGFCIGGAIGRYYEELAPKR